MRWRAIRESPLRILTKVRCLRDERPVPYDTIRTKTAGHKPPPYNNLRGCGENVGGSHVIQRKPTGVKPVGFLRAIRELPLR